MESLKSFIEVDMKTQEDDENTKENPEPMTPGKEDLSSPTKASSTLEKLMNTYLELSAEKVKGENIKKTLAGIEGILDTIKPAFERMLNDLYEDRAIDISADITVLENMLESEGLKRPENNN